MKNSAIQQCITKDEHIKSVVGQKRFIEQQKDREKIRRIRAESEIHSLRSYIDHKDQRNKEKSRNKNIQTDISLPLNYNLPSLGPGILSGKQVPITTFATLVASANARKFKRIEDDYQRESIEMREKFVKATSPVSNQRGRNSLLETISKEHDADPQTNPVERRCISRDNSSYVSSVPFIIEHKNRPENTSSSIALKHQYHHKTKLHAPALNMASIVYNSRR